MPYIAIKGYPKDEETKKKITEKINEVFLEIWGCPQEAISISIEEVAPEKWEDTVVEKEIKTKMDKMMIVSGKREYEYGKN